MCNLSHLRFFLWLVLFYFYFIYIFETFVLFFCQEDGVVRAIHVRFCDTVRLGLYRVFPLALMFFSSFFSFQSPDFSVSLYLL